MPFLTQNVLYISELTSLFYWFVPLVRGEGSDAAHRSTAGVRGGTMWVWGWGGAMLVKKGCANTTNYFNYITLTSVMILKDLPGI